jgi:ATP-dependent Clp protease ATP-binding subunit ClpC
MTNFDKFEKFTKEARQALVFAQEKAKEAKLNYVGTEHILLGVLSQPNSLGAQILLSFGVSLDNVSLVLKTVGRTGPTSGSAKGPGGLSGFAKKVIEDAAKCAHHYNHSFVGTEHLLYSIVDQDNTAATVILENMKVNPQDVKDQIVEAFERNKDAGQNQKQMSQTMNPIEALLSGLHGVLVGNPEKEQYKEAYKQKQGAQPQQGGAAKKQSKTPALDYFTTDLIQECRQGKIDPVVGRSKEIERVVSILCRRTKNNPVIIGEPGVGKTAIIEGLAHAIVAENVPESMLDKRILALSMTSVVAGTKYRGEFEERVKQIIEEASSQNNVLLFIDEIHTVIGAGSAEGSLDAANILKPALSRGKVQVVGATTTNEYRKQVETDAALERRFQPILVNEPEEHEALEMMEGIRSSFEEHHSLIITDEALEASVYMSKRYINDRYLPDKAIDLMDEAASLKRVKSKGNLDKIKGLQKELQKVIKSKEEAVSKQNYEHAADLRNKELEVSKKINDVKTVKIPRSKRQKITEDDIAKVVSSVTGIPVTKLVKSEISKLMTLEDSLRKRIVGQEEAIKSICQAIRRSRAGFSDTKRPIGSFIFLGPTGVGKTELVKALAEEVYNDKDALVKIDMSEFMERHSTSRLVGTTAGYVGYEDGGQLTETIRRKPYSVVLFDEIEKAHPDIFNLLLQILEDGVLTDSKGRAIDFKNTIIVMTSNIGAEKLTAKAAQIGFSTAPDDLKEAERDFEAQKEDILQELKKKFRPEFLNRVDHIVTFHALTHNNIKEIVKLHVGYLENRLNDKRLKLELTPGGLEVLSKLGYDPDYGARPVRRAIRDYVEDPLTQLYLEGKFKDGDVVKVEKDKENVKLAKAKPKTKKK